MQDFTNPTGSTAGNGLAFPYKLEDLISWTVKRSDGTVAKFTLAETAREELIKARKGGSSSMVGSSASSTVETYPSKATTTHLSEYCDHTPKSPIAEWDADEREAGGLRLYVGDGFGARKTKDEFDFVIDGGDVITFYGKDSKILLGDEELIKDLRPYTVEAGATRVLKIDWWDRKAPDVIPEFWSVLNGRLHGDVMTCCQGGHGRSGTSFVCLLMNNSPDYSAFDAIVHLRAVHCPRAIESVSQHEYIDDVAKFLGREPDSKRVREVKSYKETFTASTKPTAVRMRKILGWK